MKKLIVNIPITILVLIVTNAPARAQNFKAEQYVQSASIELKGSIDQVFPLFTVSGEQLVRLPARTALQPGSAIRSPA